MAKRAASVRAFFALELAAGTRDVAAGVVALLRDRPGGDAVRWVRPESLHVTLRFLGEIEAARAGELARRVGEETGGCDPFELRLGALQAFPSARRPRVLVLAVEPADELVELAGRVERGVVAAGLPAEERPFRPHLTLGRLRSGRGPGIDDWTPPPAAPTRVSEVVLLRSHLGPGGSRYTPLERVPLGGDRSPRHHG